MFLDDWTTLVMKIWKFSYFLFEMSYFKAGMIALLNKLNLESGKKFLQFEHFTLLYWTKCFHSQNFETHELIRDSFWTIIHDSKMKKWHGWNKDNNLINNKIAHADTKNI